jgi:hypothetical protein
MNLKRFLLLAAYSLTGLCLVAQSVGIGTGTPNVSAKLDITSTNSGLLPPRMTTAQRYSIVNPVPGLMMLNTSTQSMEIYTIYDRRHMGIFIKNGTAISKQEK